MLAPRYGGQLLALCENADECRLKARQIFGEDGIVISTALSFDDLFLFVASAGTGWSRLSVSNVWKPETVLNGSRPRRLAGAEGAHPERMGRGEGGHRNGEPRRPVPCRNLIRIGLGTGLVDGPGLPGARIPGRR